MALSRIQIYLQNPGASINSGEEGFQRGQQLNKMNTRSLPKVRKTLEYSRWERYNIRKIKGHMK